LSWSVVEAGLTPSEFWELTPIELQAIQSSLSIKIKRELRTQAHFTACLINSILGSLSKNYEPIKGGILIGEDDLEDLTDDQKWNLIGG
jgi:hypothetical protein